MFPEATVKAFADDLGGVFKKLADLTKLEEIFDNFAAISGLHVKPAKSKIIPLGREPNNANFEEVRSIVRELAPAWGCMWILLVNIRASKWGRNEVLRRPGGNLCGSLPNERCTLGQRRSRRPKAPTPTSTTHRWQRCWVMSTRRSPKWNKER